MPIHEFNAAPNVPNNAQQVSIPHGLPEIPGVRQEYTSNNRRTDLSGLENHPTYLEERLFPGFRYLDESMKNYWSGIKVPTKDSYRYLRTKIAGGDKSLMVWTDELKDGRARLPVAAISREDHQFNEQKYNPPYHALGYRYLNTRGSVAAKYFRPLPFLVTYNITIWSEHKRDMEYIISQMLLRFNPIAEFKTYDGKYIGNVQLRYQGLVDASDKEVGFNQQAMVRYELNTIAEAWLPLPEVIVPTVMGRVTTVRETTGTILASFKGSHGY